MPSMTVPDISRRTFLAIAAAAPLASAAPQSKPMPIGLDLDDVVEYERASPSAVGLLTEVSPAQAVELTRQVRDDVAPYASPTGVTMPGAAWLVTAQAG